MLLSDNCRVTYKRCSSIWYVLPNYVVSLIRNSFQSHTHTHIYIYIYIYMHWLRAGRSGIESRWGRDFPPVQTGPGAHPASCKMGTGSLPGVKCGRGVLLTPFYCRGHGRVELYLYPPSGPHRACNGITLPYLYTYIYFHIYIIWLYTLYIIFCTL